MHICTLVCPRLYPLVNVWQSSLWADITSYTFGCKRKSSLYLFGNMPSEGDCLYLLNLVILHDQYLKNHQCFQVKALLHWIMILASLAISSLRLSSPSSVPLVHFKIPCWTAPKLPVYPGSQNAGRPALRWQAPSTGGLPFEDEPAAGGETSYGIRLEQFTTCVLGVIVLEGRAVQVVVVVDKDIGDMVIKDEALEC
ncbi:hypothetical protein BDV93DRAFT_506187 [Ceratobasidium sp. AG-I]|nr:hypothetical protein BDV93DRAFT_506187 [Ceratobasidium sp. AG-I]